MHHVKPAILSNMTSVGNPYKEDIDFAALAIQDADFARVYVRYVW
jgi:hypothetical protein